MSNRMRRTVSILLLLALLFVLPVSAERMKESTQLDEIPNWLWFMGFDRTPNAVRSRFNTLAAEWSGLPERNAWPKPPSFDCALPTGDGGFVFCYSKDDEPLLNAQHIVFSLSGTMDGSHRVESMDVLILPQSELGRSYLRASDQLMQLMLFSLFDKLDERTNRNLTLQYIYDVRPFSFRGEDLHVKDISRTTQAVVDGQLIELTSGASAADSSIQFHVRMAGAASDDQKQAAATNDNCNRLLSQTGTECADLKDCAQQLSDMAAEHTPNWDVMRAMSEQISEGVSVIDELCFKLYEYPKALTYASRMHEHCDELLLGEEELAERIGSQSISEIQAQLANMLDLIGTMQSLTTLLHK